MRAHVIAEHANPVLGRREIRRDRLRFSCELFYGGTDRFDVSAARIVRTAEKLAAI